MTQCRIHLRIGYLYIIIMLLYILHRPLRYERVYLLFCKEADTPFHIQGDDYIIYSNPVNMLHSTNYVCLKLA